MKRAILESNFYKAWGELNYYQKEGPFLEQDEDNDEIWHQTKPNTFDIDGEYYLKTIPSEYVDGEWYGWLCAYGTYENLFDGKGLTYVEKETTYCFDPWCRYEILFGAYLAMHGIYGNY